MKYPARFNEDVETVEGIPLPDSNAHLACDWGNPVACRDDNTLRAEFAGLALKAYAARVFPSGSVGEEPATVFSDLLGDLMHLADALGEDFVALVESGEVHYLAELNGEF